jgi:type IV pilus biogenesis protein CpaD/CtpE
MSRAFAPKDDPPDPPAATYSLPGRDDAGYDAAAAAALLQGARIADTATAEVATGYRWGEPRLRRHVEKILELAIASGDERLEQVAGRFLRAT